MRGAHLLILTILVLSVQIQVQLATAHEDDQGDGPGFELQANPVRLTTFQGGTVSSNITLSLEGEDPPVQAQLILNWDHRVPSDVSYSFNPTSIGLGQTSTLTFITHSDSSIGNFHFHVFAAMGNETESIRMALKIKHSHGVPPPPPPPPPPSQKDFTLNVSPTSWTINANETTNYNVTLAPINGFNQAVSLSVTPSAPTGATITLTQTTVTPPALLQLKIATTSSLKNGTYSFTVTATNGSLTHQASVYMIVLPVSTLPPSAIILTLSLSKNNITLGDMITISGRMTPPQGLGRTLLEIIYANATNVQSNKDWNTLSWVRTNTTAGYAYDWTPTQTGYYALRAIWGGNATHTAFSNIAILRVNSGSVIGQSPPEFPWFWLALAAIIIIGVATAVTLKIRKKPVPTPTPRSA